MRANRIQREVACFCYKRQCPPCRVEGWTGEILFLSSPCLPVNNAIHVVQHELTSFVTETSVYCAVRTECLNIIQFNCGLQRQSSMKYGELLVQIFASQKHPGGWNLSSQWTEWQVNPYPTAFPYGNGMVLHFYQQQESSTTKTVHKVINKGLKAYV